MEFLAWCGRFLQIFKRKKFFFFVSLSNRNCNFPHLTSRLFRLLFAKGRSDGTFETCNNVFLEVKWIVEGGSKVENGQGGEYPRWRMVEVENDRGGEWLKLRMDKLENG